MLFPISRLVFSVLLAGEFSMFASALFAPRLEFTALIARTGYIRVVAEIIRMLNRLASWAEFGFLKWLAVLQFV